MDDVGEVEKQGAWGSWEKLEEWDEFDQNKLHEILQE